MKNYTENIQEHYLLQGNNAILNNLATILEQPHSQGFFLLGRIKNYSSLKEKYGNVYSSQLTKEIISKIKKDFFLADIINEKYFFIIATKVANEDNEALVEDIKKIIELDKNIKAKYGIAVFPKNSNIAEELFTQSYLALKGIPYADERAYLFFDEFIENQQQLLQNKNIAKKMKSALKDNRILLAFQPIIDSKSKQALYYECTLRMQGDEDLLAIDDYIAIAEKFGFIKFIDELVLDLVIDELQKHPQIKLSVNVSNHVINNQAWLKKAKGMLKDSNLSNRLIIEVGEKIIQRDLSKATLFMNEVHKLGCQITIDNFGFSYTSFTQLKNLPISRIKIDEFFTQGIINNYNNEFFIKSVIELTHRLKILSVADSAENYQILEKLANLGIDELQDNLAPTETPSWRGSED